MGKFFANSWAGICFAGDESCDLRSRQAQHQASAPVCCESANQGGGAAAGQVQFSVGAYDEQFGGGECGVLLRAAVRMDHDADAAHMGTFARVLWRTLVLGYRMRILAWHFELFAWACSVDSAFRRNWNLIA